MLLSCIVFRTKHYKKPAHQLALLLLALNNNATRMLCAWMHRENGAQIPVGRRKKNESLGHCGEEKPLATDKTQRRLRPSRIVQLNQRDITSDG